MKKLSLLSLFTALFFIACSTDEIEQPVPETPPVQQLPEWTLIPDQAFENALIQLNHDDVLDGRVLTSRITDITTLRIEHKRIKNISGIENFIGLEFLSLWDNDFTTINVRSLKKLKSLGLSECPVNEIDLSQNTELIEINFQHNSSKAQDPTYPFGKTVGFTKLDLRFNTKLERIYVWTNRLTKLDVSMLPNLTDLCIGSVKGDALRCGNPIQTLDLSKNPRLISLWAGGCDLRSLNIKGTAANRNGVPQMCITADNPNLFEIKVNSVAAVNAYRNQSSSSGVLYSTNWWAKDPQTNYVE